MNFTLPNLYIAAGHFDWWYVSALMARTLVANILDVAFTTSGPLDAICGWSGLA